MLCHENFEDRYFQIMQMKLILHSVLWKALDIKDPFISVGLLLLDTRVHLYISMLRMLFVSFGVLTAVLPPVEEPMNQVLTQLLLVRQLRF